MAGGGIVEKIGAVGRSDGEMKFRILFANGFDYDFVAVDARGGGVVVEGAVDAVVCLGERLWEQLA